MDAFLFGEAQGRIIITVPTEDEDDFVEVMEESKVNFCILGEVKGKEMLVDDESFGTVEDTRKIYENVLPDYMKI
jgi:phosphoribosylformylglycinamidine synthase